MTGNNIWPKNTKNLAMGPTLGRSAQYASYSALGGLSQSFLAAPFSSRLGLPIRLFLGAKTKSGIQIEKMVNRQPKNSLSYIQGRC